MSGNSRRVKIWSLPIKDTMLLPCFRPLRPATESGAKVCVRQVLAAGTSMCVRFNKKRRSIDYGSYSKNKYI